MKNRLQIIIVVLLVVCGYMSLTAKESRDNYIYYRSGQMMEKDGMLTVEFTADIVGGAVSNLEAIRITPKLITESNSIELPDLMVVGSNKKKVINRWTKIANKKERDEFKAPINVVRAKPDGNKLINYITKANYEEWMDSAQVVLYVENIKPANRSYTLMVTLPDMVRLAPYEPYEIDFTVNYITPLAEAKSRKKEGRAFLDFPVGRSVIIPTYRRNPEELRDIQNTLDKLVSNPDITVNEFYIEGYASPEGNYSNNLRLSEDRANAMKKYIIKNFTLPIPTGQIKVSSGGEDWDGLKVAVEQSDLPTKERIVEIIDNTPDVGQRKSRIRLLGGVYNTLLRDFFPQLRRVEYLIDYVIKDYSVAEAEKLLNHKEFSFLNQREMFDVAMKYGEGTAEYEQILLDYIPRNYPDDMAANINAAAVMINRGEYITAKRYLEEYKDSPEAWNNLGVIALIENQLDLASQYFNVAARRGVVEAEYNLKEVEMKRQNNIKKSRYQGR